MTLRLRLTLVAAIVVAIVVAAASLTTYFVMRHELYSQVDSTLSAHAARLQQDPGEGRDAEVLGGAERAGTLLDGAGLLAEGSVELGTELVAHHEVRRHGRHDHNQGHDTRGDKRQAAAETHGSRKT